MQLGQCMGKGRFEFGMAAPPSIGLHEAAGPDSMVRQVQKVRCGIRIVVHTRETNKPPGGTKRESITRQSLSLRSAGIWLNEGRSPDSTHPCSHGGQNSTATK